MVLIANYTIENIFFINQLNPSFKKKLLNYIYLYIRVIWGVESNILGSVVCNAKIDFKQKVC